jgi:hypothetical protein
MSRACAQLENLMDEQEALAIVGNPPLYMTQEVQVLSGAINPVFES